MKQQQEEEERKRQRKEKKKEKKVSTIMQHKWQIPACCLFNDFFIFELKIITGSSTESVQFILTLYQMFSERTGSPTWTWGRWPWHCCHDGFWWVWFLKEVTTLCWLHLFGDLHPKTLLNPINTCATKNHFWEIPDKIWVDWMQGRYVLTLGYWTACMGVDCQKEHLRVFWSKLVYLLLGVFLPLKQLIVVLICCGKLAMQMCEVE